MPDVIFDQSIGALLGMDILKPLETIINTGKEKVTLMHDGLEIVKQLVQVRGIRSKHETMAALVSLLYRHKAEEDVHLMVHAFCQDILRCLEIPLIDTGRLM